MKTCLKCHEQHAGKYQVCAACLEAINTEWTQNGINALHKLQEVR